MATKAQSTKNLDIIPISQTDAKFKELDVASSVNMSLPVSFKIPEKPEFSMLVYKNFKDEDGNPRKGLGIGIVDLKDNSNKTISISTLTRKFFDEEVSPGETSGKSQRAVIDVYQDVNTMDLKPSEAINLLAGKTVKESETIKVWLPKFKDQALAAYEEKDRAIYTIA